MDIVSPSVRSAIMSKVRSRGNKSTELRLRALLARAGIRGWRTNARDIEGSPDVVFDKYRLAIFIDGCFWHGCPKCYRRPKSNRAFWDAKLAKNHSRDLIVSRTLRANGWAVIRVFECDLRANPSRLLSKISKSLPATRPIPPLARAAAQPPRLPRSSH